MTAKQQKNGEIYLIKIYGPEASKSNPDKRYLLGIYACDSKLHAFDCANDRCDYFLSTLITIEKMSRKKATTEIQALLGFNDDLHSLSDDELIERSQWWYCYELRSSEDLAQRTQGFLHFTDLMQAQDTLNRFKEAFPRAQAALDFGCEKVGWRSQANFYKKTAQYAANNPQYKANQWVISNYQRSQTILNVLRKRDSSLVPQHIFE